MGSFNVQDIYLNELRKGKVNVTVILVSGVQLRGIIKSFDNFLLTLEVNKKQQVVYKHAISTIKPAKPVPIAEGEQKRIN